MKRGSRRFDLKHSARPICGEDLRGRASNTFRRPLSQKMPESRPSSAAFHRSDRRPSETDQPRPRKKRRHPTPREAQPNAGVLRRAILEKKRVGLRAAVPPLLSRWCKRTSPNASHVAFRVSKPAQAPLIPGDRGTHGKKPDLVQETGAGILVRSSETERQTTS